MKKENIKNKMLSEEQARTVKEMIIASMRSVYTDVGVLPGDSLTQAAGLIADKIVKDTQMALLQNNTFANIVKKSKSPKKKKK